MSSWISQAKNYHRKDWLDFLNKTENLINSTIDKVSSDYTNNSLYTDGGIGDLSSIWETPIEKYCLTEIADRQKTRLMSMSMMEKNVTLNKIGDSTTGISNQVSDEVYDYEYEYTEGNNYLNEFQKSADETTTQTKIDSNNYQNYSNNGHNVIYGVSTNHYYDDNFSGLGEFGPFNKINETNKNSILWKTNQLFRERKMNTIISRFHTDNEKLKHNDTSESARSMFGLSHGRNLLTYDAERYGNGYDVNGYNNPYCRVWTHHHQYSEQRSRMMRPFYTQENVAKQNVDLHNWNEFTDMSYNVEYTEYDENKIDMSNIQNKILTDYGWVFNGLGFNDETIEKMKIRGENVVKERPIKWSWKSSDSGSNGWENSVLNNKTGTLNITPKFLGGAEKNIHTKDCMFSIENLAWQGYDPYSFERALSWEQRGPFGGRIMWFPPYGLSFSEDSSVQWNEHSFIGRGESVFTYTNTARSGTLSFMMLVDHPSIIDYATWHNPSDLKDTDIMRFFAGCDGSSGNIGGSMGGSNGILQNFAKPTPLTDEYLDSDYAEMPAEEVKPIEEEQEKEEKPTPSEEIQIKFYVFFPNNYSGYYDNKQNSNVDPIAYLLYGRGAQWKCNIENVKESETLPISFTDLSNSSIGYGYEMLAKSMMKPTTQYDNGQTQEQEKNYIIGTNYCTQEQCACTDKYNPNSDKWYYRIDGEYKAPICDGEIKNCFAQNLIPDNNGLRKQNTISFSFNSNISGILSFLKKEENKNLYSLSEIAYCLSDVNEVKNKIRDLSIKKEEFDKRTNELKNYFDKKQYTINSISCKGFSNSHGSNASKTTNDNRNIFLAFQRRSTVINWFRKNYKRDINVIDDLPDYENVKDFTPYIESGVSVTANNENAIDAKFYRSAIVTLYVTREKVEENPAENQAQVRDKENQTEEISEKEYSQLSNEIEKGFYKKFYRKRKIPVCDESNRYCNFNKDYAIKVIGILVNLPNDITEEEYEFYESEFGDLMEETYSIKVYKKQTKNTISYKIYNTLGHDDKLKYNVDTYVLKGCEEFTQSVTYIEKSAVYSEDIYIDAKRYNDIVDDDLKNKYMGYIYSFEIKEDEITEVEKEEQKNHLETDNGDVRYKGFKKVEKTDDGTQLYINTNETNSSKKERKWYYDENKKSMVVYGAKNKTLRNNTGWKANYASKGFEYGKDKNSLRYDQEYYFFKQLEAKHPDVFSSLVQKVQYFDPAFHSMTPEGFMGRLNFLHQCTRQGNTISASDKNGHTANNLAFGRPPFCILRLGDFYYQKIVIRNINITYDPLVLDLNNEGVGVVPLIANVTISFNFIGGGDLTGPVRRLQNAMSFNYYANGRLYDNRADRVERKGTNNWDTMDMGQVDFENSYFHDVKMSTKNK